MKMMIAIIKINFYDLIYDYDHHIQCNHKVLYFMGVCIWTGGILSEGNNLLCSLKPPAGGESSSLTTSSENWGVASDLLIKSCCESVYVRCLLTFSKESFLIIQLQESAIPPALQIFSMTENRGNFSFYCISKIWSSRFL